MQSRKIDIKSSLADTTSPFLPQPVITVTSLNPFLKMSTEYYEAAENDRRANLKPSSSETPSSGESSSLTSTDLHLLAASAITAKSHAYCPYSNFRVGASVLISPPSSPPKTSSPTRTIFTGSNVEIAATPVGTCAERCALANLVASYQRPEMPRIRALAVASDIEPPASPCGMCRQFIREFCAEGVSLSGFDFFFSFSWGAGESRRRERARGFGVFPAYFSHFRERFPLRLMDFTGSHYGC